MECLQIEQKDPDDARGLLLVKHTFSAGPVTFAQQRSVLAQNRLLFLTAIGFFKSEWK
jgi:hypothetical protein